MSKARLFHWSPSTPLILQQQTAECGPACIAMISSHHGKALTMSTIRQQCIQNNYSLQGMNLLQLSQLAALNELTSRAFRCEIDELATLTLPCILHWDLQHFVVLTKIKQSKNPIFYINAIPVKCIDNSARVSFLKPEAGSLI